METRLLDLLVCPICKGPLEHWRPPHQERQELVCHAANAANPPKTNMRRDIFTPKPLFPDPLSGICRRD